MDESRKQFEEFARSRGISPWKRGGEYADSHTQFAFSVWQASRAAIEIALPSPQPDCFGFMAEHFNSTLEECAKAIRAAGIKVKE